MYIISIHYLHHDCPVLFSYSRFALILYFFFFYLESTIFWYFSSRVKNDEKEKERIE